MELLVLSVDHFSRVLLYIIFSLLAPNSNGLCYFTAVIYINLTDEGISVKKGEICSILGPLGVLPTGLAYSSGFASCKSGPS